MNDTVTPTRPRRPRRKPGERAKPCSGTVGGVLDDGSSAVSELLEEMREWQSSLEGNNMEHLPKYD